MNLTVVILALIMYAFLIALCSSTYASTADYPSSETTDSSSSSLSSNDPSECVTFNSEERMIKVTCTATNLSRIADQLKDRDVLQEEAGVEKSWILNAGVTVAENSTLYVNSTDTLWLKIVADGETAYPIQVLGGLKIDSTKISSWDPNTNDYMSSRDSSRDGKDVQIGTPRPYIVVRDDATGTTDITNSEIAHMGYESGYGGDTPGLRYDGGDGSVIIGNSINDLYFGFYSSGIGGIVIENNYIHDNIHYGLDPHTGTHEMIIKNNTVTDNGSIGIICSLDCYDITIENNTVNNNTKMGIMLSRNMTDSIIRNNNVGNEDRGIVISESSNNQIYNNTVSESGTGIDLDKESFENVILNNTILDIEDPEDALEIEHGSEDQNTLFSNILINSGNGLNVDLDHPDIKG